MAKKEIQQNENKIEQLKNQIDNWVNDFNNNGKNFDRFELYEGNSISLGL